MGIPFRPSSAPPSCLSPAPADDLDIPLSPGHLVSRIRRELSGNDLKSFFELLFAIPGTTAKEALINCLWGTLDDLERDLFEIPRRIGEGSNRAGDDDSFTFGQAGSTFWRPRSQEDIARIFNLGAWYDVHSDEDEENQPISGWSSTLDDAARVARTRRRHQGTWAEIVRSNRATLDNRRTEAVYSPNLPNAEHRDVLVRYPSSGGNQRLAMSLEQTALELEVLEDRAQRFRDDAENVMQNIALGEFWRPPGRQATEDSSTELEDTMYSLLRIMNSSVQPYLVLRDIGNRNRDAFADFGEESSPGLEEPFYESSDQTGSSPEYYIERPRSAPGGRYVRGRTGQADRL
ncbi:hypothetical protein BJ742DRAFT_830327 [Cladochytrium replicatum]|nr:hypothetical protein BJ742DRAFT_830327 [Cladochytrium replicatum]